MGRSDLEQAGRDVDERARDAVEAARVALSVAGHQRAPVGQERDAVPAHAGHDQLVAAVEAVGPVGAAEVGGGPWHHRIATEIDAVGVVRHRHGGPLRGFDVGGGDIVPAQMPVREVCLGLHGHEHTARSHASRVQHRQAVRRQGQLGGRVQRPSVLSGGERTKKSRSPFRLTQMDLLSGP